MIAPLDTNDPIDTKRSILIIGGGITGMTVAIEAAEAGLTAHIVEASASLGGRVAQLATYFPKMCPPSCGLEMNYRRMRNQDRIRVHTLSQVTRVEGSRGKFQVTVEHSPRRVRDRCTACNACVEPCPVHRDDPHNLGLTSIRAIGLPFDMAYPHRYAIDSVTCQSPTCSACVDACKVGAINLNEPTTQEVLDVGAIVVATGWQPYDATKLTNLGFGSHSDIITNLMMERITSPQGSTNGRIVCPSNGRAPSTIAFIQCAGSRDNQHLPYCSSVCCAATMKQILSVRAALPNTRIRVFYIDIRTLGRLEHLTTRASDSEHVSFERGKVGRISIIDDVPHLHVENTLTGAVSSVAADLVVLATGMVPSIRHQPLPFDLLLDDWHFGITDTDRTGIIAAGCARRPFSVAESVRDATAAVLRAMHCFSTATAATRSR